MTTLNLLVFLIVLAVVAAGTALAVCLYRHLVDRRDDRAAKAVLDVIDAEILPDGWQNRTIADSTAIALAALAEQRTIDPDQPDRLGWSAIHAGFDYMTKLQDVLYAVRSGADLPARELTMHPHTWVTEFTAAYRALQPPQLELAASIDDQAEPSPVLFLAPAAVAA